jgi:hypothetical protein
MPKPPSPIRPEVNKDAPADHFCRLLEPTDVRFNCETLRQLALSMCPTDGTDTANSNGPAVLELPVCDVEPRPAVVEPPPAYTYFGQFIDHDLSRDDTPLQQAGLDEPINMLNTAGGYLDLHHVYGDGPESAAHGKLYKDDASGLSRHQTRPDHPESSRQPLTPSMLPCSRAAGVLDPCTLLTDLDRLGTSAQDCLSLSPELPDRSHCNHIPFRRSFRSLPFN